MDKAYEGDMIQLANQEVKVEKCQNSECEHLMVNLDLDQLAPGDLKILKQKGVRISNPKTTDPVCLNCEWTVGDRLKKWWDTDTSEDDDDDSDFFSSAGFLGGSTFGGLGGFGSSDSDSSSSGSSSFGGFGGGNFSGGGATASW